MLLGLSQLTAPEEEEAQAEDGPADVRCPLVVFGGRQGRPHVGQHLVVDAVAALAGLLEGEVGVEPHFACGAPRASTTGRAAASTTAACSGSLRQ